MRNAYDLVMNVTTLTKILDSGQDYLYFPFDPNNPKKKDIKDMLKYFEWQEEYDKCIKLKEHLKTI
jgi:hypothetical protein